MQRSILSLLLIVVSSRAQDLTTGATTAIQEPPIYFIDFPAEEPGSGGGEGLPECRKVYLKHEKMYLRGVKEPNHVSYNETTFEECEKLCCYETKLECKSFSYLEVLSQCFIMNVTRWDRKVELVAAPGHVHAEIFVIETTTPEPPTTTRRPFATPPYSTRRTASPKSDKVVSVSRKTEPGKVSDGPNRVDEDCPKRCVNGGRCHMRRIYNNNLAQAEAYCVCPKGYSGDRCQDEIMEAGGLPIWLIAVIAMGGVILLLFLALAITYFIYYKKTGEYKVLKAIRRWARGGKKSRSPATPDEFNDAEDGQLQTSPTTSVGSIHGSLTSSATHSTSTSV